MKKATRKGGLLHQKSNYFFGVAGAGVAGRGAGVFCRGVAVEGFEVAGAATPDVELYASTICCVMSYEGFAHVTPCCRTPQSRISVKLLLFA
jgi:hypothetical protein